MSKAFQSYEEAHKHAQEQANVYNRDMGLELIKGPLNPKGVYVVRFIPSAEKRFGCDYTCEVVEPMNKKSF